MKKLYIIGARGFGREIYNLAKEAKGYGKDFEIIGFLDDKSSALDGYNGYPPIVSSVEDFTPGSEDVFTCALGDASIKKEYVTKILKKGGQFINLIHKDAYISDNVKMGTGCIVCAYTRISCDITIGDFNTFQPFCCVGHDVTIGDFCHFNTYSFMGGFVQIGNIVTLHTGAIVHPHKSVGDRSIVGAGAVVLRNIKPDCTVFGNPARKLEF